MKIVIITPTRNEDNYIRITIESLVNQTILPSQWIIVDDGSKDSTYSVVKEYSDKFPFIKYIDLPDRGFRKPGQGVIEAFYEGFKQIDESDYNIIAKMDADLQLPPNMLEVIVNEFKNVSDLGITGAVRYERKINSNNLSRVIIPKDFVGGPTKFYRRKCFEDIGGLVKRAGWDGVDIIKANIRGWRSYEINSLKVIHLKYTGSAKGEGALKAYEKYGDVSYYMGGYFWFLKINIRLRRGRGRQCQSKVMHKVRGTA